MIHKIHFPALPLSQFVENIWYVEGNHPEHTREKLLPDGAIELIIDLDPEPKKLSTTSIPKSFVPVTRLGFRAKELVT